MREILFKAKRIDNGEWVEGYYVRHIKRTICPFGDEVHKEDVEHIIVFDGFSDWNMPRGLEYVEVDPETVCQYTGLVDKNGMMIFEGDVINVKTSAYAFESVFVKWCQEDSAWCFCCENGNHFRMLDSFKYEVIDNIHRKKGM